MKTRLSIGLPPAPEGFLEGVLDPLNAMRAMSHHSLAGTDDLEPIEGGCVQRTVQGTATFAVDRAGMIVGYEPDLSVAADFRPVVIRLARASFPGSPLWDLSPADLVPAFCRHVHELLGQAKVAGYRMDAGSGECFAAVEADADADAAGIEALVEDLSNGADVASNGAWCVRRRWRAFGCPALAEPHSPQGAVYRIPSEEEPDPVKRQAGYRIRMIQRFMEELPPALVVTRSLQGGYDVMPYSLTRRAPPPELVDETRRLAVAAFHRLTALERARQG